MRIVLTNDDGFDAPGLAALWQAVRLLGDDVEIDVIAPALPQSGKGHTFSEQVRIWQTETAVIGSVLVVDGSPTDCACVAGCHPEKPRPDWLIAGINRGSNLGIDVYASGTVAAARQAAILGIPSVAVSQLVYKDQDDDWARSARETTAVLAALIHPGTPAPDHSDPTIHRLVTEAVTQKRSIHTNSTPCWNVNLPRLPDDQPTQAVKYALLSHDPVRLEYELTSLEDGSRQFVYVGNYHRRPVAPGTDVEATFKGAIAISLLPL